MPEVPGDDLVALEEQGWQALATSPDAALAFYGRVLDAAVEMLLPGGMRVDDRAGILAAMGGPPWASYTLEAPLARQLTADSAVVTYGVVAQREGSAPYSALMSSVYVRREDGWKLVLHQQTPR
ncbi:nuclear transport factor 2 family protein [Geodermatophilus sp. SYSU D00742]